MSSAVSFGAKTKIGSVARGPQLFHLHALKTVAVHFIYNRIEQLGHLTSWRTELLTNVEIVSAGMCAQQKPKHKQMRANSLLCIINSIVYWWNMLYSPKFVRHVCHYACIWSTLKSKMRLGFFLPACLPSYLLTFSLRFHSIVRGGKMGGKAARDVIIHQIAWIKSRKQNEENRAIP